MAVTAAKTFVAGEILTASDLNAEFSNVYSNGQTIGFPRTAEAHFKGQEMWLDDDKDSSFTADTDDRLDLKLKGVDLFRWDGTVATPVNGLDFIASATLGPVQIKAVGSDTNISINLIPKGGGDVLVNGTGIQDAFRRSAASNVVSRTLKHRMGHIEANHIGEAQSLGF